MHNQNLDISKLSKVNKRTFILLQQSFPNIQNNPILNIGHVLDLFKALPEYQPHFRLLKGVSNIFKHVKDGNLNEKKEWLTLILHLIDRDPKLSQQYDYDIDELRKIGLLLSYLSDYDLFPIQIKGKEYSLDDISLLGSCLCTESFLSTSLMETQESFFSQFKLDFDMEKSHFMAFLPLDKWIELSKIFHSKRKSSSARLSKAINAFDDDRFFDQNIFAEFSPQEIADYLFSKEFNKKTASLLILALPKSLRSEAILNEINKRDRSKLEKSVIALLENILKQDFRLNDKLFSTLLSFISNKEQFIHYFEKSILQYLKNEEKIENTSAINFLMFNCDDYFHFNPHWKNDIDFSFIANVEKDSLLAKIVLKLAEILPVNESLFNVIEKRKPSFYIGLNNNKTFHFYLFKSHNGKRIFDYFTPFDKLFFLKDYFSAFDNLFSFDEINQLKSEDLDYLKLFTSQQYWVDLCGKIDFVDLMDFFKEIQKTTLALKIIEKTGNKALWEKVILSYAKLGERQQFETIQWLHSAYVDKKDNYNDPFLLDLIDKCLE